MAHTYTEEDYKLQQQLSRGTSAKFNLPFDLREDAFHFCVVKGLERARCHDDRISGFNGVLIYTTWRWTLEFFRNLDKRWRKNMNVGNIIFSDDPPSAVTQSEAGINAENMERIRLCRSVAGATCLKYMDYAARGFNFEEIAKRTGVARQAVHSAFKAVRDNVLKLEESKRAS